MKKWQKNISATENVKTILQEIMYIVKPVQELKISLQDLKQADPKWHDQVLRKAREYLKEIEE